MMRAVVLREEAGRTGLSVEQVPKPTPGPGEALVGVEACGVNRIDLLLRDGETPVKPKLPLILGCEFAGTIAAVGDGVAPAWSLGDRVVARTMVTCGRCPLCLAGRDNLCEQLEIFGVDRDGGYAEYVVVPQRCLIRLPDHISTRTAAAVVGTGPTVWRMLVTRGRLRVGETALIIAGTSGIGVLAVQLAKAAGARVIATAGSAEKLARLRELGADEVVDHSQASWHRDVRRLTDGAGVDLVFEHVGAATFSSSISSMKKGARLVTCGGHTGFDVGLNLWHLFAKEIELIGSFAGSAIDARDILAAVARGDVEAVVHGEYPLEQAHEAQQLLAGRESVGKVLLVP
jgi:NADPH:quinone reductase-like Zn-dependent oxidoreductase